MIEPAPSDDVRGSTPVMSTKDLLLEVYHDVKLMRPALETLILADLPRRVLALEVGTAVTNTTSSTSDRRYQERFEAQTQAVAAALAAQEKAVAAALLALDKQSGWQDAATAKQLEGNAVWRDTYGNKAMFTSGRAQATADGWKYLLGAGSILIGLLGVVLAAAKLVA